MMRAFLKLAVLAVMFGGCGAPEEVDKTPSAVQESATAAPIGAASSDTAAAATDAAAGPAQSTQGGSVNTERTPEIPADTMTTDGCHYPKQHCRCSNTGWYGYCAYGPMKPGLYCHC